MARIKQSYQSELEIKRSRFITYLNPVENAQEAKEILSSIRKLHPKASHHCSALLLDANTQRSSDDGEPGGTAGLPMLEVLRMANMDHIQAVVVRYFGGVLLGAGGLIRAYRSSVAQALKKAEIFDIATGKLYRITCDYPLYNKIENLLKATVVYQTDFAQQVTIEYLYKDEELQQSLMEITKGQSTLEFLKEVVLEIKRD
ncbi:MAG: YigZ family protein [Erysipelotrichaceae bacterium]|jgi:uncharacterized YigZ family protein|nr:YigZ family protein [Erysipelotrichaceae bacterium]